MARVLTSQEGIAQGSWRALTPAELNEAYARLEERYNCLRSNWEWFTRTGQASDKVAPILERVEQN